MTATMANASAAYSTVCIVSDASSQPLQSTFVSMIWMQRIAAFTCTQIMLSEPSQWSTGSATSSYDYHSEQWQAYSAYNLVSEAIFDLANDLIRGSSWNPLELKSPNSNLLHPPNKTQENKPFGSAKDLLVYVPLNYAFCDGYIDDLVSMAVDLQDHVHRSQQALSLSSYSVFRQFILKITHTARIPYPYENYRVRDVRMKQKQY